MAKQNKTNTTTTKPKGDIDFEKELWDVANELRGAVAENQYKDYVLSLLFLKHRERLNEILFIDACNLGNMVNRRLRVFADADVARIADTYHQWRNLNGTYADTEGFCKAASLAEVAASNCVLSPGRYVGTEAEETDGVPFEEKMKTLTTELAGQFAESALLEKKIRENLAGIGFELV